MLLMLIVSGGVAGGTAAAITTPMDVCKTVLNTQDVVDGKLAVPATVNATQPVAALASSSLPSKAVTTAETVVLKTPAANAEIRGLFGAAQAVIESQGVFGLFRGMKARVVAVLPGTAISRSIYEYFKWMLSRRNQGALKNLEQKQQLQKKSPDTWV